MNLRWNNVLVLAGVSAALCLGGCSRWEALVAACEGRLDPWLHPSDPIVAQAGTLIIRASDYDGWLQFTKHDPAKVSSQDRERFLKELLRQRMVIRLAQQAGADRDPAFRARLKDLEYRIYLEAYRNNVDVSESEMKAYFAEHGREFPSPEAAVSVLVVKTPAQARVVQRALREGRPLKGWTGKTVARSSLGTAVADAKDIDTIFALKTGEFLGPRKVPEGYEFIRRENDKAPSYESVKSSLRSIVQFKKIFELSRRALAEKDVKIR